MAIAYERSTPEHAEAISEALTPPRAINPATGLPYGWDEESELDGLDDLLTG